MSSAADKPSRFQPGNKAGGSGSKTVASKTGGGGPDSVMPGGKAFGVGGAGGVGGVGGKPTPVQVIFNGKIVTPMSLQYRPKAKTDDSAAPKSNIMALRKKTAEHDEAELNKNKTEGKKM